MLKAKIVAVFILFLTSLTYSQQPVERVSMYLDSLSTLDGFSGAVLVAKGGVTLFEKAYGMANVEKQIPNRVATKFNLGSINKVFTQVAIDQLVRQKKISPSDHIGKFLPDYPNKHAAETVTIQQLLTMTSGIGDFFGERYSATPKEKIRSLRDYLPLFADKELEFEPGTGRRYSNGGYIVLGAIIEAVTGTDYYTYVKEHVFKPAGMDDSDWFYKDSLNEGTALGYTGEKGSRKWNNETLPGRGSSAGGGYSTVHDLLGFTRALKAGVLQHPLVDQMGGIRVAGGAPGISASLEWNAVQDLVVVVLSNYEPPVALDVAQAVLSRVRSQ